MKIIPGVKLNGLSNQILLAIIIAEGIYKAHGVELVITSGTLICPRFDLFVLKAKLLVSTLVSEIQLKMVVFPILVKPIIPHCKPIVIFFPLAKVQKLAS